MADKNGIMHVRVPDEIVSPNLHTLIDTTFPDFDEATMTGHVILAPTNDDVDIVNGLVMQRMTAPARDFMSYDSVPVSDCQLFRQLIFQSVGQLC